jgi:hypothetical protein
MPDYGTVIDGAARSDNINLSGLPLDMESRTHLLDPNSYVFLALTRKFGAPILAKQMKHEYRERRLIPNFTTIAVADAAGQAHIEVTDYTRIKNDFLLYIPRTGELLLVQDASIDATVSIVRATTGTGTLQYATVVGDKVIILSEAHAEGEAVPTAFTNQSSDVYDYIMQKDRCIEATDIEEAIQHYDPREKRALDRKQAFIEYQRDRNVLYYVGKRTREIVSASGRRRHIMGGVFEKFTENQFDVSQGGAGFTRETIANILGATKYHGASSSTKMSLWGTNAWRSISSWPVNALQISPREKAWGVRINTILTGFGDLDVAYDPVLSAEKGLEDRGIVCDPAHIRPMRLQGLKVRMFLNINNASDIHNVKDAISGTFGLQARFNELHAQVEGIQ